MKATIKYMILMILIISMLSCERENEVDFFNNGFRIGLWINTERGDTLQFLDSINLIRKGDYYTYEEYRYRIDGEYLFVRLPFETEETQHKIKIVDQNTVVLVNMYISIEFLYNSGTFRKE